MAHYSSHYPPRFSRIGSQNGLKFLAEAIDLAGFNAATPFGWFFDDFPNLANWTASTSGTGVTPVLLTSGQGGVVQLASGAGTGTSRLGTGGAAFSAGAALVASSATPRFYLVSRFRCTTAVDANATLLAGLAGTTGANDAALIGLHGAVSTTQFGARLVGAGLTSDIVSAVAYETSNYHTVRMWGNGAGGVYASIDYETPQAFANVATRFPQIASSAVLMSGGQTATRVMTVDYYGIAFPTN